MRGRATLLALAFAAATTAASGAEVAGVKLDERVRVGSNAPELVLNGAGVRTRIIVDVYVAGLYLTQKKSAAEDVLALSGAKRMSLVMLRDLTARQIAQGLSDGFKANNAAADQQRYQAELDELTAGIGSLGEAKKGDVIALDYLPNAGMRVILNGEPKGRPVGNEGFYRAVLRVWLGDRPVDAGLKRALLGQS